MEKDGSSCILLVEDDIKLAGLIGTYLSQYGFSVVSAEGGLTGLNKAQEHQPDLIVLDLMLPELDGLSVCRELRTWYRGRIVMLTASDEDMDQVAALEIGADDFVKKPIHPRVLLARIRMLLRREEPYLAHLAAADGPEIKTNAEQNLHTNIIVYGQLKLHRSRRQTQLYGNTVSLTEAEFNLLWLLAKNPETPLSRDEIMKSTRGVEHDGLDRSIDNRIVSLRRKLDDNTGLPKRIITVRGKGYLFVTDQWDTSPRQQFQD